MTRHRTDPVSLIFGLLFVGVAIAAWAGAIRLDAHVDLQWVWPVLLLAGGLTLLAGVTRRGDVEREPALTPEAEEAPEEEPADADG